MGNTKVPGRTRIERILRAVEGEVWACQPEKLAQIAEILAAKAESGLIPEAAEIAAVDARQRQQVQSSGAIAVIPLFGTISRRMGMLGAMSGGASIETFQESFRQAMADTQIDSILIRVHSPGGSVYGVEEAARMVMAARDTKRVVTVADQLMASAAYYIGSAAGEVVVTPSGEPGSIGVYTIHFDWSQALDDEGVKPTIIKAGDNKAEGNPYGPLSKEAREHQQSIVDAYYKQFVTSVAKGRRISTKEVEERFGQGRTFDSARALERGMVDRVATFEETVDDLRTGRGRPGHRASVAVPAGIAATEAELPIAAEASDSPALESFVHQALGAITSAVRDAVQPTGSPNGAVPSSAATLTVEATPQTTDPPVAEGAAAASQETISPTQQAPEAAEERMPPTETAPQSTGANQHDIDAAIAAERERSRQIRAICSENGIDGGKADEWISAGHSVEHAKGLALDHLRGRDAQAPSIQVGADREAEKPFASLGEQLQAVVKAEAKTGAVVDRRLLHLNSEYQKFAAASGANTSSPSEGGFVLQMDFTSGLTAKMWEEGKVLQRTNRVPISEGRNGLVRNQLKEHSRKDGSRYGGVRVYRTAEAGTVEASKQQLRQQEIKLEKLMGLYYATEEILQDAMALTAEAERGFRRELIFVSENEIFRGTGAGQCLGVFNSNALVTVAKEAAQDADTVNVENVAKMMARLPASSLPTAAWYIHQFVIPQLVTMTIGNQPVFIPGGNVAGKGFGTLFGIPVDPVEYCAPLGDLGDINLFDFAQYTTIDRRGVQWQESIHVRFLYDETAFKLTYRFNGEPDWDEAVTPFQGTDKISPFITLAERA